MSLAEMHGLSSPPTPGRTATIARSAQNPMKAKVPIQWKRVICKDKGTAYYISPSGQVLLNYSDLKALLDSTDTCKCYIDGFPKIGNKYMLDFTAQVENDECVENASSIVQRCEGWAEVTPENLIRSKILQAINYLTDQEVQNLEDVHKTLYGYDLAEDPFAFHNWMDTFEWDKIRVLWNGRMFLQNLSYQHLLHLTYTLVECGKLKNNTPDNSVTISTSTNCDTNSTMGYVNTPDKSPIKSPAMSNSHHQVTSPLRQSVYMNHVNSVGQTSPLKQATSTTTTNNIITNQFTSNHVNITPPPKAPRKRQQKSTASNRRTKATAETSVQMVSNSAPATTTTNHFIATSQNINVTSTPQQHQQHQLITTNSSSSITSPNAKLVFIKMDNNTSIPAFVGTFEGGNLPSNLYLSSIAASNAPQPQQPSLQQSQPSSAASTCNEAKPNARRRNVRKTAPKRAPYTRKPRGKKANQYNEMEDLDKMQAAAEKLRKQNEELKNKEELAKVQAVVANVLNKPRLTKQEDSGHLKLPRFETLGKMGYPLDSVTPGSVIKSNNQILEDSVAPDRLSNLRHIQFIGASIVSQQPQQQQLSNSNKQQPQLNVHLTNQQNTALQQSQSSTRFNYQQTEQQQQQVQYSIDGISLSNDQHVQPSQQQQSGFDFSDAAKLDHAASLLSLADNIPPVHQQVPQINCNSSTGATNHLINQHKYNNGLNDIVNAAKLVDRNNRAETAAGGGESSSNPSEPLMKVTPPPTLIRPRNTQQVLIKLKGTSPSSENHITTLIENKPLDINDALNPELLYTGQTVQPPPIVLNGLCAGELKLISSNEPNGSVANSSSSNGDIREPKVSPLTDETVQEFEADLKLTEGGENLALMATDDGNALPAATNSAESTMPEVNDAMEGLVETVENMDQEEKETQLFANETSSHNANVTIDATSSYFQTENGMVFIHIPTTQEETALVNIPPGSENDDDAFEMINADDGNILEQQPSSLSLEEKKGDREKDSSKEESSAFDFFARMGVEIPNNMSTKPTTKSTPPDPPQNQPNELTSNFVPFNASSPKLNVEGQHNDGAKDQRTVPPPSPPLSTSASSSPPPSTHLESSNQLANDSETEPALVPSTNPHEPTEESMEVDLENNTSGSHINNQQNELHTIDENTTNDVELVEPEEYSNVDGGEDEETIEPPNSNGDNYSSVSPREEVVNEEEDGSSNEIIVIPNENEEGHYEEYAYETNYEHVEHEEIEGHGEGEEGDYSNYGHELEAHEGDGVDYYDESQFLEDDYYQEENGSPEIVLVHPNDPMDDEIANEEEEEVVTFKHHQPHPQVFDPDEATTSSIVSIPPFDQSSSYNQTSSSNGDYSQPLTEEYDSLPPPPVSQPENNTENEEIEGEISENLNSISPNGENSLEIKHENNDEEESRSYVDSPVGNNSSPGIKQEDASGSDASQLEISSQLDNSMDSTTTTTSRTKRSKASVRTAKDKEIAAELKKLRQMERLKKQLEFQGRPNKDNSSDVDIEDPISPPPLPPEERVFRAGDVVFGQRGDVRYWPGKILHNENGNTKVRVLWFGKGDEKESFVEVDTLITADEGLNEYNRIKKRHRARSGKRTNVELENAIIEAANCM